MDVEQALVWGECGEQEGSVSAQAGGDSAFVCV